MNEWKIVTKLNKSWYSMIMPPIWYILCQNCERSICYLICANYFGKKVDFGTKTIEKKLSKHFGILLWQHCLQCQNTCLCWIWSLYHKGRYGYAMILVIWLESVTSQIFKTFEKSEKSKTFWKKHFCVLKFWKQAWHSCFHCIWDRKSVV